VFVGDAREAIDEINDLDHDEAAEGVKDRSFDQVHMVAVNKSQGAQDRGENQQDDQVWLKKNQDPTQGVVFPQGIHGILAGVTWIENRSGAW
jgi:hypothetical protein